MSLASGKQLLLMSSMLRLGSLPPQSTEHRPTQLGITTSRNLYLLLEIQQLLAFADGLSDLFAELLDKLIKVQIFF